MSSVQKFFKSISSCLIGHEVFDFENTELELSSITDVKLGQIEINDPEYYSYCVEQFLEKLANLKYLDVSEINKDIPIIDKILNPDEDEDFKVPEDCEIVTESDENKKFYSFKEYIENKTKKLTLNENDINIYWNSYNLKNIKHLTLIGRRQTLLENDEVENFTNLKTLKYEFVKE